ncbi:unnamed protein product [Mucor hiemalis]
MTITDPRQSLVIVKAIIHDGRLYQMEYKDHKNTLLLVLLQLYNKDTTESQLAKIYNHMTKWMGPLLTPKISKLSFPLHIDNWQDYLGDRDMYSSYLEFFDRQMVIHGVQSTLDTFFYNSPMEQSIGSQRFPVVHLALGIQNELPEVIGQALSYMAAFYQDTSFLMEEPAELCDSGYLSSREILIEQVKVDPRFGSFPMTPYLGYGERHESKITYHKVLKNSKELLRTYVYLWRVPIDVKEAINELRILAAHIMLAQIKDGSAQKHKLDLENSSNLLATLNALDALYPDDTCPTYLIRIQFLNIILSYIVQGRPDVIMYSKNGDHKKHHVPVRSDQLVRKYLEKEVSQVNIKTILALKVLEEAQNKTSNNSVFNKIMSCI